MSVKGGMRVLTIIKGRDWYKRMVGQKLNAFSYDIRADEYTVFHNGTTQIIRGSDVEEEDFD